MSADNINYKDALVIAPIKDGVLDLPFPIFACFAVKDNQLKEDNLSSFEDGDTVLANINYKPADEDIVFAYDGYVEDFQNDPRVLDYWNIKKSDWYRVYRDDEPPVEYNGSDGDELAPFCSSNVLN